MARVVFMGTPAFAVPALRQLIKAGHHIIAVYTQPPRPAGRGYQMKISEIHQEALLHNLPVHTPLSLKTPEAQAAFKALKADIAVVAAYGLLLPKAILEAYPLGCINIHPSLLPRWRGAAPLQRTLLAGDKETGVTIMNMDIGLDTGPILLVEKMLLSPSVTISELHDLLSVRGAVLVEKAVTKLIEGTIEALPQPKEGVTYAAKLSKEDGIIDWEQSAETIDRQIRALTPWPGVSFFYQGEYIKVHKVKYYQKGSLESQPGTIIESPLKIACGEGIIELLELQRSGKKILDSETFLRGFAMPVGTRLTTPYATV